MTKLKLDSKLAAHAASALDAHAGPLYATPGVTRWIVAEIKHVERTEPAPEEDNVASVKLRITHLEVANPAQEETMRRVLRALHLHRTAYGTLIEDMGEIELAESTLENAAGELSAIEAARLHATIDQWTTYGRRVLGQKTTTTQLRQEFDTVIRGLRAAVDPGARDDT